MSKNSIGSKIIKSIVYTGNFTRKEYSVRIMRETDKSIVILSTTGDKLDSLIHCDSMKEADKLMRDAVSSLMDDSGKLNTHLWTVISVKGVAF